MPAAWQHRGVLSWLLFPLSLLFALGAGFRRFCYRSRLFDRYRSPVPVVVVGNITVGGSGKTPLVSWLVEFLRARGWRPGIVSRGYGGRASRWPQQVRGDSDPFVVGDEAVLLAQRVGCPVCVSPNRPQAIKAMLEHTDVNIVLSDDGLQHYAMDRDIEIAVIDGERRLGNGFLLPAGPLREPASRLKSVDFVICNGEPAHGEFSMQLKQPRLRGLQDGIETPLQAYAGRRVRAIAGIGNPQRFFDMLTRFGLVVEGVEFPDHHAFSAQDLAFDDGKPLLMTEKDAVKCRHIFAGEAWVVVIDAQPDDAFMHRLGLASDELKGAYDGQAPA